MRPLFASRSAGFLFAALACAIVAALPPVARADQADSVDAGLTLDFVPESCEPCDACELPPSECTPRWTFGADYLLMRPSFSNSTAVYQSTSVGNKAIALQGLAYDFGYTGGIRGFIGYNFSRDTTARFGYMAIDAATSVAGFSSGDYVGGNGTAVIGPFLTQAVPAGGFIKSTSKVDLDVYDMELARRFEVDPDVEGPIRWDTAGSAGIRFVDSSVSSTVDNFCPLCPDYFVTTNRTFHGVGPRLALQGRRYLGRQRRWSAFANGGAALLVGQISNFDSRLVKDTNLLETQSVRGTLVIPNLDISLGTTWQWLDRTSISAGWMLMYWGHLGYSETIETGGLPPKAVATSVPLTNSSLAYDGFFLRLTHSW